MTTSRDLSEKLYKAGLEIETEKWHYLPCQSHGMIPWGEICSREFAKTWNSEYVYPAYSTDELLAVMPEYFITNYCELSQITILKIDKKYRVCYKDNSGVSAYKGERLVFTEDNLSEALGLMCLWLLQNGYHYDKEKKCLTK